MDQVRTTAKTPKRDDSGERQSEHPDARSSHQPGPSLPISDGVSPAHAPNYWPVGESARPERDNEAVDPEAEETIEYEPGEFD